MSDDPKKTSDVPTLTEAIDAARRGRPLIEALDDAPTKSQADRRLEADRRTVWVDVDRTIAAYDRWQGVYHFGPPLAGAHQFMARLAELGRKHGFRIGLFTTRVTVDYPGRQEVVARHPEVGTEREVAQKLGDLVAGWAARHGIPFAVVWTGQGKPTGLAYVDDLGVHCSPQEDGQVAYEGAVAMVESMVRHLEPTGE